MDEIVSIVVFRIKKFGKKFKAQEMKFYVTLNISHVACSSYVSLRYWPAQFSVIGSDSDDDGIFSVNSYSCHKLLRYYEQWQSESRDQGPQLPGSLRRDDGHCAPQSMDIQHHCHVLCHVPGQVLHPLVRGDDAGWSGGLQGPPSVQCSAHHP